MSSRRRDCRGCRTAPQNGEWLIAIQGVRFASRTMARDRMAAWRPEPTTYGSRMVSAPKSPVGTVARSFFSRSPQDFTSAMLRRGRSRFTVAASRWGSRLSCSSRQDHALLAASDRMPRIQARARGQTSPRQFVENEACHWEGAHSFGSGAASPNPWARTLPTTAIYPHDWFQPFASRSSSISGSALTAT